MNDYLQTALSGWSGVALFGSGLAMPYLLRRTRGAKTPYLRRMWPHFWLGYMAFLVSFVHAWFTMRSGNMRGINAAGVWIANWRSPHRAVADRRGPNASQVNSIQSPRIAAHSFLDDDARGRPHHGAYRAQQAVAKGGVSMKKTIVTMLLFLSALVVQAASAPADFAGNWTFDSAQSKNVGMMGQAKIQTNVTQSKTELVVDDNSVFNGQADNQHTTYDLTGRPVTNTSTMAGQATTRSHWEGARLITEWNSAGAIAGTTTTRIETRYLSADGKTMYVESARPGKDTMLMVFTKDK